MTYQEPFPLKNLGLWSLLVFSALLTAYIVFVAIVSIWIGLDHSQQDGFWVPILAGTISMMLISWVFLRFSRFILNRMREKDTITL